MMGEKKRYDALDGVRTLACIGIVLMHVLANTEYNLSGFIYDKMIPSFTNLTFLFMSVSGFGMCCGYYDRMISGNIDIVSFYKKRYKKILPFFALLCFMDLIISPSLNSLYEVFANLTLCFGLIPNADITVIGVGWFLGTVFAFYMLFPFFCFLLADKKRAWLALIASYIMNYLCRVYFDAGRKSIAYSFIFFMVGGMVYIYKEEIEKIASMKWISIILLVLSVGIYYFVPDTTLVMLLIGTCILMMSLFISEKGLLINPIMKFIGGISFEIYLCHMFIFRIVEKLHLSDVTDNDYINYILLFIAVFAGATVFAYVAKMMINKTMKILIKE
ncbi:MAG: acyltransferase [Pseudobutyrivibrio sp.]|uniref:acyltransferase family protein n=1 Tax=Pseudobutyrivibrio sp. TaxID=2014367 RepID=UPI0025D631B3|nr:acyltransferase [Pseudobutyrivibrio sp.]MBQ6464326.1 acyltransferase [Pseudobutyrivibrio sp.]